MDGAGAFAFGVVIGWVTYRTLRRKDKTALSDISTVIGAVGGAAVTKLFEEAFDPYCIGLAVGFFLYLVVSLVLAARTDQLSAVNEWLGEPPATGAPAGGGGRGGVPPKPDGH